MAENLMPDNMCHFRVNSTEKAGLIHQSKSDSIGGWHTYPENPESLISQGTLLNATHIICDVNADLTRIGETVLHVSIGTANHELDINENNRKTAS